jgi:hypothetical protein
MLQNTKLVIGKACAHKPFRRALFEAAVDPPIAETVDVMLRDFLEAYEIYPTDDELRELIVLLGPLTITDEIIDRIVECLSNEPVGGELSKAVDLRAIVLALLKTYPNRTSALEGVLALVNCVFCDALQLAQQRFGPPMRLSTRKCPTWPCPSG